MSHGEVGEGAGLGTMTLEYEPHMKSGTWNFCGMTVLSGGGSDTMISHGTWQETGPNTFRNRGTGQFSDKRTCGIEFDIDATTEPLILSGELYEWI